MVGTSNLGSWNGHWTSGKHVFHSPQDIHHGRKRAKSRSFRCPCLLHLVSSSHTCPDMPWNKLVNGPMSRLWQIDIQNIQHPWSTRVYQKGIGKSKGVTQTAWPEAKYQIWWLVFLADDHTFGTLNHLIDHLKSTFQMETSSLFQHALSLKHSAISIHFCRWFSARETWTNHQPLGGFAAAGHLRSKCRCCRSRRSLQSVADHGEQAESHQALAALGSHGFKMA